MDAARKVFVFASGVCIAGLAGWAAYDLAGWWGNLAVLPGCWAIGQAVGFYAVRS